jgi:NAD(P)-dependent dehydrogenase (short-subunit alcohol dehydrogenase family)
LAKAGALKGKSIFISGGGTGFGKAMALEFSAEGAVVAVCGRRKERLDEVKRASGGKILTFVADVANPKEVRNLPEALREHWGELDVLVNNAGVLLPGALADYSYEKWRGVLDTNLSSVFLMTNAFLPMMKSGARIINITSGLGFFPMSSYGAYCASKAGLNMLSRAYALELSGKGILVNTVDPGVAKTEMNTSALEPASSVVPIVRTLAALGKGGPTGRFFKKSGDEIQA